MYLEPRRRRRREVSLWPWVFCSLLAIVAAWYLYSKQVEIIEAVRGPLPTPTPTEISAGGHVAVGDRHFAQGRFDLAVSAYERATELAPTLAVAYARWARILALRHDGDEALSLARRAVELDAESAECQAIMGMVLDWNGQVAEAIAACLKAIKIDSDFALGYAYLSEA